MQADVNTEATDGHSALQGAHVVRPLTVSEYLPTDTTDTFRGVSYISELTDDVLLAWLKDQIAQSSSVITPDILEAELKKRVKLDVKEADAKMRFMNLFMKYYTFLEERNLGDLIHSHPKTAIRHICALIRPLGFQKKIENDLALDKAHPRKDWKGFYQHVVENAVSFEDFYASMVQAANRSSQGSATTQPRANWSEMQKSHGTLIKISRNHRSLPRGNPNFPNHQTLQL